MFNDEHGLLPPSRDLSSYPGELAELISTNSLTLNNDSEPDDDEDFAATWAVYILPYLEQANAFALWNLTTYPNQNAPSYPTYGYGYGVPFSGQSPTAVLTQPSTYLCPSRRTTSTVGRSSTSTSTGGTATIPGALIDYGCSLGSTGLDFAAYNSNIPPNGAFRIGVQGMGVTLSEITDGLSNTVLIGEKHIPVGQFGNYPYDCCAYDAGDGSAGNTSNGSDTTTTGGGLNSNCWGRGLGTGFPLATVLNGPNSTELVFGSYHDNIVQFVFADGSVHALSTTTSTTVLQAIATINGNEPPFTPTW